MGRSERLLEENRALRKRIVNLENQIEQICDGALPKGYVESSKKLNFKLRVAEGTAKKIETRLIKIQHMGLWSRLKFIFRGSKLGVFNEK